jgi:hypothetical protein
MAERYEAAAIKRERPIFNIHHNGKAIERITREHAYLRKRYEQFYAALADIQRHANEDASYIIDEIFEHRSELLKIQNEYRYDYAWLLMALAILKIPDVPRGSDVRSITYHIRCPWGYGHTDGDENGAYIRLSDRRFAFVCYKCYERNWSDFVDEVVMPRIVRALERANKYCP